jgi:hypothetical protein
MKDIADPFYAIRSRRSECVFNLTLISIFTPYITLLPGGFLLLPENELADSELSLGVLGVLT